MAAGFGVLKLFQGPLASAGLSYEDLLRAADYLSEKRVIGRGGCGTVYKAMLDDGAVLAVKVLDEAGTTTDKEFVAELAALAKVQHAHLVPLRGYFVSAYDRFLIYDYMPGGNLGSAVHANNGDDFKDWQMRYKAALGTARGIKYLHHECCPRIIHRDIKVRLRHLLVLIGSTRVICRGRYSASTESATEAAAAGTVGYLAPECSQMGRYTEKSDVFSFGVVLLQLLTGRRPMDPYFSDEGVGDLMTWVASGLRDGLLLDIIDASLEIMGSAEMEEIVGALRVALLCTAEAPTRRPTMEEAVYMLENLREFGARAGNSPSHWVLRRSTSI
eukprot:SM000098S25115  [mRNA]  locus=s98:310690:312849:+ [translate_table: standard]